MARQHCAPDTPVAILSFHSHSDRSFLDDRELALLSGTLRQDGIDNDLVVTVIRNDTGGDGNEAVEHQLTATLEAYNPIVYERLWDPQLIERLRQRLPGKLFIELRGEHVQLYTAAADVFCEGNARHLLAPLIEWLRGQRLAAPSQVLLREPGHGTQPVAWSAPEHSEAASERQHAYMPNLRPVVVNPEALPARRTFSIMGNAGCPYQADARLNPLYAGTDIPTQFGRGCAFCTTGNHYEGRPNPETAAYVLEQIRYVRRQAGELQCLVLKDQNPFGYLTEVIEGCAAEDLKQFTILLETRAEWFLRNARRFDRALEIAAGIEVRLAPFLVGIENFSQPELDRFNKGITVATNIEFLETLWRWKEQYGDALDLSHAAFGFILFTPWTTLQDLEANLAGIRRTHFDRLRGSVLLSRARLYPDTALYYLAERDGLLAEEFASEADNASRRYGYYPSRPWRHRNPDVAHFALLATELAERNQSRDMVNLFDALLAQFRSAGEAWATITTEQAWQHYQHLAAGRAAQPQAAPPAPAALRQRFERLVQPLSFDSPFAGGWQLGHLSARRGHVEIELRHAVEASLSVEIVPRSQSPHFGRSRHYLIRANARDLTAAQHAALSALSAAIIANDR